jgi:diguanylate cyclase (GGDEF)-like protein
MFSQKKDHPSSTPMGVVKSLETRLADDQDQAAEIVALKARIAELERQVVTDSLTPVYNRRFFISELDRWCWRAHRYGGRYGLLYCDVDNLKQVNDQFGHAAGDAVLIAVAIALGDSVRKSDIVARIGGDEFAILLDNILPGQLPDKTESIRKMLGALAVPAIAADFRVSASIGACPIGQKSRPADVMDQADKAMYADKHSRLDD